MKASAVPVCDASKARATRCSRVQNIIRELKGKSGVSPALSP